ncbi:hypothetical protein CERZMDRAFT_70319 [Cercospora zeae-maydis SCOH1-5]|uniref:Uncharacterized protein n=1 Tax=Cercospora zeae-maydis SCOH1-5 TaxID=717836 RepID=A0A6A6F791_9PEZI|nr:hypothetical protein CERZMDRAFT_70319 [Cercospora zeae-maydis SCOH1-5]
MVGKRAFEQCTLVSTGVQKGDARWRKRLRGNDDIDDDDDDYAHAPPVGHWRCNLRQNLYFVAYSTDIYVYVPQYPTQAVPQKPALIVPSQPSSPGLRGTLDIRQPHSINHLVVQRLGNEEVVAAVRDDGDVNAFLVRHLVSAIERRARADNHMRPIADDLRPFFHTNVGQSAWGLAIHSHARIIAVSANTHNITIFKFGLARDTDHDTTHPDTAFRRNTASQIINGSTNIPHIAFCNTGDDPTARWLLTTDIGGNCRSIDLHTMRPNQTFRFGPVSSYLEPHDRLNSGWGISFLDERSFISEDNIDAALGLEKDDRLPGVQSNPGIWDISQTVSNVPRCADKFSAHRKNARQDRGRRATSRATPDSTSHSTRQPASSPLPREEDASMTMETESDESDEELEDASDSAESAYMAHLDGDDEGTEDSISFRSLYDGRRIYGNTPRAAYAERSVCDGLPCPILHCSVRNVYLLQPQLTRKTDGYLEAPTVGFTNALHQFVQGEHAWLNAFERLNMHCYIPAVGVVVLASQKGRAMILSLTKISKHAHYPAEMRDGHVETKTNYAMRIEHIVPFDSQEQALERPFQPLHGIAASPIQQGTPRLLEDQRRWRLMLMYADHSILSYEISRRASRDSAVDIGSVVV